MPDYEPQRGVRKSISHLLFPSEPSPCKPFLSTTSRAATNGGWFQTETLADENKQQPPCTPRHASAESLVGAVEVYLWTSNPPTQRWTSQWGLDRLTSESSLHVAWKKNSAPSHFAPRFSHDAEDQENNAQNCRWMLKPFGFWKLWKGRLVHERGKGAALEGQLNVSPQANLSQKQQRSLWKVNSKPGGMEKRTY